MATLSWLNFKMAYPRTITDHSSNPARRSVTLLTCATLTYSVWAHCVHGWPRRCQEDPVSLPSSGLKKTNRTSPHHVADYCPTGSGSETPPPYAPRSSRFGSELPSVEDDVDVCYAVLELHARNCQLDEQLMMLQLMILQRSLVVLVSRGRRHSSRRRWVRWRQTPTGMRCHRRRRPTLTLSCLSVSLPSVMPRSSPTNFHVISRY